MSTRYACLHDLNNYFKKKDLLGGLTDLELKQLRKNIGIIDYSGEGGLPSPIELTYTTLVDHINKKDLITGARYVITDFQTIYSSNVTNSSGLRITWGTTESLNPSPVTRLVVTALTNSRLDARVLIDDITTKDWIIEYDVTKETLEDGLTTKGKITYLLDNNNNSAFYDFKNVKFRRTQQELEGSNISISSSYCDFYTFSDFIDGKLIDSSTLHNTRYNEIKLDCTNNIFLGDTYNNIIEPNCKNNTFAKGMHDSILRWDSINNLFNEPVCYTSGSIYNKTFQVGDTSLSTSITKTIHKVNEATIISFLDPITYAYQIIQI